MKIKYTNLIFSSLVFFMVSCTTKQESQPSTETVEKTFSNEYKEPVFEIDNRAEKIKALAPKIQELMENHAKERNIPGIAYGIVVDNQLVISSSLGQMNLETGTTPTIKSSFRIASMTKSFTAMAILKLRDEGKLSLEDPVSKYIPEMNSLEYLTEDSPIIDIENLLTMTAGFPEDNPWGDRQLDEPTQMLMDLVKSGMSFSNSPSFEYEYSNTGYALLGNVITRVSGIPFQTYVKENILAALGMNQTYWEYDNVPKEQLVLGYRWEDEKWKPEPLLHDGSYGSMGGLITSIEDFSKYVSFHLSAWPPRNEVDNGPIKRSSLREMQTPQFSRLYPNSTNFNGEPCPTMAGYGFGLRISQNCNGLKGIGHGGALPGFGSNYVFFPEYGIGLMSFCNLTYTSPYPIAEIIDLLFEKGELKPRKLPVSDILLKRQKQIVEMIQNWDENLEGKIVAENLYLDKSRDRRIKEIQDLMKKAGKINSIDEITPLNQLRGRFSIQTENGILSVFFTLSPEEDPRVQRLDISFVPKEPV